MAARAFPGLLVGFVTLAPTAPAWAACPMELAVYRDTQDAAGIDFRPTGQLASVTNTFRMALENGTILDGIVMWSDGVARSTGILMNACPEGDVTGAEIEACTIWQGVVYAVDDKGQVSLLPKEGQPAPPTLVLADLGPALDLLPADGDKPLSKLPFDVFALKGCQE